MGYRIIYNRRKGTQMTGILVPVTGLLFAMLTMIGIYWLWPEGREVLLAVLRPGGVQLVWSSAEELAGKIRMGASLWDSVSCFCGQVFGFE